jgi:hypothetical protein
VHGWIYVEDRPRHFVLRLDPKYKIKESTGNETVSFNDSPEGVKQMVQFITTFLGSDDWKLEDLFFLGYRIVTVEEV